MDPIVDDFMPEDLIENDDGSVTIPEMEPNAESGTEFYENLADILAESELSAIASEYCELLEKDRDARKRRDEMYADGLRRTGMSDDAPGGASFDGASKVVHPVLTEACVDFAARAMKELFPPQGPVKTQIVGKNDAKTLDRAERKKQYMNWQLTQQMGEYRAELEQLLTQLPLGGSQFQKFWYDERFERPVSEFVPIDDILLPFAATNFYNSPRMAHVQHLTEFEYRRRVKSGLYRDINIVPDTSAPEQSAAAIANDKIEGKDADAYNEDGLRDVYEIYCWLEVDDPVAGDTAPYILTVDAYTEKVLALYRNWEEGDDSLTKLDWMVEWKFIPWRGAYAIGLPHLIGGLAAALTGALRALLDSAHINNAPSAVKLKGGRVVGQDTAVEITQITEIEAPPGTTSIRDVIMPLPFNQPSPVLFQLLGFLTESAKGVVATADERIGQVGDRTPVGTTMALIEQGSTTYSAIHARLHESQMKALSIIHRLNRQYLEDDEVVEELGSLVVGRADFEGPMNVIPVSDPAIFSEAQRFAQTQALVQMSQDPSVPWNKHQIYRRVLRQMRIEAADEILPPIPEPVTADPTTENYKAVHDGAPIKAAEGQDHLSHIEGHLTYIEFNLMNPLANPQALMGLMGHIGEHVTMYQTVVSEASKQQVAIQAMAMGQMASPDALAAMAQKQAFNMLAQQLGQTMQRVTAAQQQLSQKMPQPPMPPEVQATLQIAQMENQRKTQMDQAGFQMEQAKMGAAQQQEAAKLQMDQMVLQAEQQREQQRLFMEQQQQAFERQLDQLRLSQEGQIEQLKQRIEVMNNQHDNEQKQVTELLKNRDDNQTKVLIESMKNAVSEAVAPMQQDQTQMQPDMTGQLQQLQQVLDQMNKDKTNDALTATLQGLQAIMVQMSAPKMVIRDDKGKAIGIQTAQ